MLRLRTQAVVKAKTASCCAWLPLGLITRVSPVALPHQKPALGLDLPSATPFLFSVQSLIEADEQHFFIPSLFGETD
jgi:hypothetical protein